MLTRCQHGHSSKRLIPLRGNPPPNTNIDTRSCPLPPGCSPPPLHFPCHRPWHRSPLGGLSHPPPRPGTRGAHTYRPCSYLVGRPMQAHPSADRQPTGLEQKLCPIREARPEVADQIALSLGAEFREGGRVLGAGARGEGAQRSLGWRPSALLAEGHRALLQRLLLPLGLRTVHSRFLFSLCLK